MLNNDVSFKRRFFIKDLLSMNSLVKDSSLVEFNDINDFASIYLKDRLFNKDSVNKIIVPVNNKDEVELIDSINYESIPFLIIKLNNISVDMFESFNNYYNRALLIDSNLIDEFINVLKSNPSEKFCRFCSNNYGYFRDYIGINNYYDLSRIYSDVFFKFPYFCIADIRWNYSEFEDLKIKDLDNLQYFGSMIKSNLINRSVGFNFGKFGLNFERNYKYDLMHVNSPKRIFIKDGYMYIDNESCESSKIDINFIKSINCEDLLQSEIDRIREPYDLSFNLKSSNIKDLALIRISENIKIMNNPFMIPYLTYFVDRALQGDNI